MAYDKVAGAPDDAANPSSDQDPSVSKKTDTSVKHRDDANPDRGSGDETPSFWIQVGQLKS